jgi:hypothetical protein
MRLLSVGRAGIRAVASNQAMRLSQRQHTREIVDRLREQEPCREHPTCRPGRSSSTRSLIALPFMADLIASRLRREGDGYSV